MKNGNCLDSSRSSTSLSKWRWLKRWPAARLVELGIGNRGGFERRAISVLGLFGTLLAIQIYAHVPAPQASVSAQMGSDARSLQASSLFPNQEATPGDVSDTLLYLPFVRKSSIGPGGRDPWPKGGHSNSRDMGAPC